MNIKKSSLLIIQPTEPTETTKVVGFDFDHTLVCQKSSKKFADDADDWKPLYDNIKDKLTEYHNDGWTLAIFTNQGGVEKKKITIDALKQRLKNFLDYAGIPMYVFAALKYDHNRKPHLGMWNEAIKLLGTPSESLYVGDAAGRVKGWDPEDKKRKDFSSSDRKFAHNIGIPFQTPEQFFLNHKPTKREAWEWKGFDPVSFFKDAKDAKDQQYKFENIDKKEMVILVGPPASGKSTITNNFPNHVRINRDTLKTKAKCLKLCKEMVVKGKNVIIDNTNPDAASRKPYIDIAKANGYYVRCIVLKLPKELALHMNNLRVSRTQGKSKLIPTLVYNIFYKKYRESKPHTDEGINEIIEIDWKPNFDNDSHRKMFLMRY